MHAFCFSPWWHAYVRTCQDACEGTMQNGKGMHVLALVPRVQFLCVLANQQCCLPRGGAPQWLAQGSGP